MKNKKIIIKNLTQKKIEEYLKKIGWSLKHHGLGHWMFYDCYGKITNLCLVFGERIEQIVLDGKGLFGKVPGLDSSQNGNLCFKLNDCYMEYYQDEKELSYNSLTFFPKGHKNIFISLYDTREKK
ncbi:MAG: hypothetical protein QXY47_05320 [Thermoplasmata archaeon]